MTKSTDKITTNRALVIWLWIILGLTATMVIVGGVTRLTHSGLSMVEWRPLVGSIPPLNDDQWQKTFEKYQQYPQYKKVNARMNLGEFKKIFFWEYLHRLLGRLIGIVFLLPWIWFIYKKKIPKGMNLKLAGLFSLGGLQGLMGWYMVKSGLVDNPAVSHYRLAAHLMLAFAIMVIALLLIYKLSDKKRPTEAPRVITNLSYILTAIIILQIVYGAFTAGLKAGYGMNTFPKMNGEWIPQVAFNMTPFWHNLVENNFGVQFIHRTLGWLILLGISGLWLSTFRIKLDCIQQKAVNYLLAMTAIQFTLGALTIVFVMPLTLAAAHQAGACVLLLLTVSLNHSLTPTKNIK